MSDPPLSPNAWLRYDVVSRLLPADATTLLEIGCGGGAFGVRLARDYAYTGVEPDDASYATSARRVGATGGGEVRHGVSHDVLPAEQRFDVVCAFEVLEHLEDEEASLRGFLGHLALGGHLVLSVPAFQERFGPADVYAGHFRRYSPEALSDLLTRVGLVDVTTALYGFPLGYALERGRNVVLGRRLTRTGVAPTARAPGLMVERTAGSGRVLQPREWMGPSVQLATAPFRWMQRLVPSRGTGLVARARLPH